jgi:hypothetical protein
MNSQISPNNDFLSKLETLPNPMELKEEFIRAACLLLEQHVNA